jgi:hypothetical protein
MSFRQLGWASCVLACGLLLMTREAAADRAPAPRRAEAAKVVLPVEREIGDLSAEGEGVKFKLRLPARLAPGAEGKKMSAIENVSPQQRSLVAAGALSLAAVSVVFVLRGKKLGTRTKGAILGVAALVAISGVAFGDAAPMPRPGPALPGGKPAIVIEYSAEGDVATLTIGR